MKKQRTFLGLLICVVVGCGLWGALATAQDNPPKSEQEIVSALLDASNPVDEHRMLRDLRGKWSYKVQWWVTPDSTPEEFRGRSEFDWILDSRFMAEEAADQRMGVAFKSRAIIGYDKGLQKFTMVRMNNLGTHTLYALGKADERGKVITFDGDYLDPMTGETVKTRSILKVHRKTPLFQMYEILPDGTDHKIVEIRYKRQRRAAG